MHRRPRILVDVDGPLGDFLAPTFEAIFRVTGRRFGVADHTSGWDVFTGLGLTEGEVDVVIRSMEVPGFCLGIPVVEGAREGMEALRAFADVWAVTSPFGGEHWMHERDAWLVKNLGFRKKDVLHVRSEAKHGVHGDMLVEDKITTLRSWAEHHPQGIPVLYEYPYNKNHGWDGWSVPDWECLVVRAETIFTGDSPRARLG